MSRVGPSLKILASCMGCAHVDEKSYAVQGDSGFYVWCRHPNTPGGVAAHVGDTTWTTPRDMCPVFAETLAAFIAKGGAS